VLLAFAKIALKVELLDGRVADDDALNDELLRYFPSKMAKAHAGDIEAHPLRAEIIATMITNAMINRGGPTYVLRIGERTGAPAIAIARAYVTVRDTFGLDALNDGIDTLDNKMPGVEQLGLYRSVQDLLLTRTVWFLRNAAFDGGIAPVVAAYGATVAALGDMLDRVLPARFREVIGQAAERFEAAGAPAALATRIAMLPALAAATDIHLVRDATGAPLDAVAPVFFDTADVFGIARIARLALALPPGDYYDGLARDRALEMLVVAHRRIATEVILAGGIDAWMEKRRPAAAHALETVASASDGGAMSLSRLTVAANLLADIAAA
jgi:glutamate dehydrogenase